MSVLHRIEKFKFTLNLQGELIILVQIDHLDLLDKQDSPEQLELLDKQNLLGFLKLLEQMDFWTLIVFQVYK